MSNQRKVQNILVTGGAGFIGSAFIRYLMQEVPTFTGRCVCLDLLTYAGNQASLKDVEQDPRFIFHKGDISDEALVEGLCTKWKIDTILHCAAETHVDRSIASPEAFIRTNVLGTFHLLEVVRKHPHIHFHHVSTDEVYGCLGDTGMFNEETSYKPNSPYSASKASSDHFVRAYAATYKISTTVSNCSNNYGAYQYPEKLIPLMILSCLNGNEMPVYGEGTNVRDWLYVEDHAKALWTVLNRGVKGETYNIGGGEEWKNIDLIRELIRIIAKETKRDRSELEKQIVFVKDRPGHDYRYAIDSTKIQKTLGWKPEHTFTEGLKRTVHWYLDNRSLSGTVERFLHEEKGTKLFAPPTEQRS